MTGVINVLFETGCTISDLIFICGEEARNHGDFVSCVAHLTNQMVSDDIITGREKGVIQHCAAQAPIPIPRGPSGLLGDERSCPVTVNGATLSFPELPTIGLLSWTVTATDSAGNTTVETCEVAVQNPDTTFFDLAPAAAAGDDQLALIGSTVTLDGSGSLDLDGDPLSFVWTLVEVPPGSTAVLSPRGEQGGKILSDPVASAPSFVADVEGTYVAELVVSDATEQSTPDRITVRVPNRRPTATAGTDQSVFRGTEVTLDGSSSADPDGDVLTYAWTLAVQPPGSTAALVAADTATPSFTVDRRGVFVAQLTVNDDRLDSLIDAVTVFVPNVAPVADAGPDQEISVFDTVTLDGSGSSDFEGDPLTFTWTMTGAPTGSSAALSDPTAVGPSFTADLAGAYVFELVVFDGFIASTPDTVTITTVNTPPVANAGPDQTVFTTATVELDGSGSFDVDGDMLSYQWTFASRPAGSQAAFSDPTVARPTFVADRFGIYNIDLVVFDSQRFSQSDRVAVVTANSAPVADAGTDQNGFVNDTITLDGSASFDVDGQPITYSWSFVSRPDGSSAAFSDPTAVTPSFTIDRKGTYDVRLTVSDSSLTGEDTVSVFTLNAAPIADAGADQTAFVTDTVTLDGSGSSDVDLDPLTYRWSLIDPPAGSTATLSDTAGVAPSFTIDLPGVYVAELVVNDGTDDSNPDTVTVTILNSAPVADAGANQVVPIGSTVTLDGSGSFDVDGDPLTFAWSLVSVPGGSTATLSDPAATAPSFVADLPGAYVAQLVVDDGTVASAPATVTIETGNIAPAADAGPDQTVTVTDMVQLDGTASSDIDGDPLGFSWSLTNLPFDSAAEISDPSSPQPSFIADRRGVYVAQLIVDDGEAQSVPAAVTILSEGPPPPAIRITGPEPGFVTGNGSVDVVGTVTGLVGSVVINNVTAAIDGETFTAADVPLGEGTNVLVATVSNALGESASDSITVRRDTDPPLVVIESPRDGDRLITETVTVTGTVNDIIPGATVNEDDVTVSVNGSPAAIMNRTFMLADLPLTLGTNTIDVTATDKAGNSRSTSIEVNREPDLVGIRIVIVEGNNQRGPIQTPLPVPLRVRLETHTGQVVSGRPVEIAVSRGDGLLEDPLDAVRKVTLLSDAQGEASIDFTLGSRTGEGSHRVLVTTPGSLTSAEFCTTAEASVPTTLSIAKATPARGVAGQRLSEPLSVIVTDAGGNPVANVPVAFQVEIGGGSFDGEPTAVVETNADGVAEVFWTLAGRPGRANNEASATFEGYLGFPAIFALSGVETGPPEETRVSGVVQDSTGQPIEGVRAVVRGTPLEALTGPDGRFSIEDVPPGGHRVGILGSTVSLPGTEFPDIDFAVEAFSGADNELDQVVVLPFLDVPGARLVGGDEDVILEMAGVEGFAIKVFAGSVIRPDGTRGEVMMSSSQVKFDKVPMAPPQGGTPFVVGTLQPAGIRFDPPAQVIYPNVEGLAPGDVADIFAFHQDVGQFVNVGPGTVSEDGSVIASDTGFGIVQSGWHCLIRMPGDKSKCANGCKANWEWGVSASVDPDAARISDRPVIVESVNPRGDSTPVNRVQLQVRFQPTADNASFEREWEIEEGQDDTIITSLTEPTSPIPDDRADEGIDNIIIEVGETVGSTVLLSRMYVVPPQSSMQKTVRCRLAVDVHAAKIDFTADENQNYGYDEFESPTPQLGPEHDFISLADGGAKTTFNVAIEPAAIAEEFIFVSDDTSVVGVAPQMPGNANATLALTSSSPSGSHNEARIEARVKDDDGGGKGPMLEMLMAEVYRENIIDVVTLFRVRDPSSPRTTVPSTVSLSSVKTFIEDVWKQAVIRINTVNEEADQQIAYDLNRNGQLDRFLLPPDDEFETFINGLPQVTVPVVFLNKVVLHVRLEADAHDGENFVDIEPGALDDHCPGDPIWIGPVTGDGIEYEILDIEDHSSFSRVILTEDLREDHPQSSHTIHLGLAGFANTTTGLQVVTPSGGIEEMKKTVAHELLHNPNIGGILLDLSEQARDNIMFHATGSTDVLLRKRPVELRGPAGGCGGSGGGGSAGTDEQWDRIPRR